MTSPTAERPLLRRLDASGLMRWSAVARSSFARHRSELDALNVFPVPDGDTGTNLYLTLDAALDAARTAYERDPDTPLTMASMCRVVSKAMLLTARGNSGVIMSQLFQGLAQYVIKSGTRALDGPGLAGAFVQGDVFAWACVAEPREGTILSVSRALAEAATAAATDAQDPDGLASVAQAGLAGARAALERTPEQLPVLAAAGVVDAGGAGLVLLVEALARVITGERTDEVENPLGRYAGWSPPNAPVAHVAHRPHVAASGPLRRGPGGPAFEVMYLLGDTDAGRVATLKEALTPLGDSLLVVGDEDTWNVHVHVDDVGAAIEAGLDAGRPHRISVTHFGDQIAAQSGDPVAIGVVACAAGVGLADLLGAAGAVVVASGPGRRASAGQLLDAIRATRAGAVIVLPNDTDTELAAHAAARAADEDGIRVRVVRARTAVQGIAALAVFDPTATVEDNVVAMSAAAAGTRHGGVTVAEKAALTAGGPCEVGDVLGIVDGTFVLVGADLTQVAEQVLDRLLAGGGELLTVVTGADAPTGLADSVVEVARARRPDLEVTRIEGGQELYPLLLGVE